MAYTSTLRLDIPLYGMAKLSSMCLKLALAPSGQIFAYRNMPGHVAQHVAPERNIRRCSQRAMFHPTELCTIGFLHLTTRAHTASRPWGPWLVVAGSNAGETHVGIHHTEAFDCVA